MLYLRFLPARVAAGASAAREKKVKRPESQPPLLPFFFSSLGEAFFISLRGMPDDGRGISLSVESSDVV